MTLPTRLPQLGKANSYNVKITIWSAYLSFILPLGWLELQMDTSMTRSTHISMNTIRDPNSISTRMPPTQRLTTLESKFREIQRRYKRTSFTRVLQCILGPLWWLVAILGQYMTTPTMEVKACAFTLPTPMLAPQGSSGMLKSWVACRTGSPASEKGVSVASSWSESLWKTSGEIWIHPWDMMEKYSPLDLIKLNVNWFILMITQQSQVPQKYISLRDAKIAYFSATYRHFPAFISLISSEIFRGFYPKNFLFSYCTYYNY